MNKTLNHILHSRYFYIVLLGVIISLLINLVTPKITNPNVGNGFYGFVISISITFLVWEGSLRIDKWMNKVFPWEKKPLKRAVSQAFISIIFSTSVIYLGTSIFHEFVYFLPELNKTKMTNAGIVLGALFTLILMGTEIGVQFFNRWKNSLIDIEKYKKETAEAQLENLKSQVNPHFLFNNLSVLSSLVYKDKDKAVDFINQFSKVYRYILDNKSKELVELETELKFIQSYCYLLIIRFGDSIKFDFQIADDKKSNLLPPMALQLLIENTIKHNETTIDEPLQVNIYTTNDYLIVANNLQLRKFSEPSSKMGLKNITSRYHHFTKMDVKINETEKLFEVHIPLLKSNL